MATMLDAWVNIFLKQSGLRNTVFLAIQFSHLILERIYPEGFF
jgi:hypothetical protein